MSVLVTGGAGYIGSHAAHALIARGERVVVLDNFCTGVRAFVPASAQLVEGSVGSFDLLRHILSHYDVEAVLHFAGSISVPDSLREPLEYYLNNTANSSALLEACIAQGIDKFIFSSSAAVYGTTNMEPVKEIAPTEPLNPYGRSKLMVEQMLQDVARAHDFRFVALRYFNVAGVDTKSRAGQPERQVPHLIKRAAQVVLGLAERIEVFGTDYPTIDGTGVRDYIHITDLIDAHLLALEHLREGGASTVFNCGYGTGASVMEVVAAFERVSGKDLPRVKRRRRPGDAAFVVADSSKIRATLGWKPRFDSLELVVESALDWERHSCPAHKAQPV